MRDLQALLSRGRLVAGCCPRADVGLSQWQRKRKRRGRGGTGGPKKMLGYAGLTMFN